MAAIGLVSVDSKIPNLALMKLSAWHKAQGDTVKAYEPLFDSPDRIYASKVFDFTADYGYYPEGAEIVRGGTGYDMTVELPPEIEAVYPDYDLYQCDYAMGFTTRGCIRRCPFCVVPRKEGRIRAVGDLYSFWRGQKRVKLLDNNLTSMPEHFELVVKQCIKERVRVDFSQGLDIRLVTLEMAELLAQVRLWKRIHFAWDDIAIGREVREGIKVLEQGGVSLHDVTFYVLIGFDSTPEQDLHRVETLRALRVNPFVMPYDKAESYQRRFARWCNNKAVFESCMWPDYKG